MQQVQRELVLLVRELVRERVQELVLLVQELVLRVWELVQGQELLPRA